MIKTDGRSQKLDSPPYKATKITILIHQAMIINKKLEIIQNKALEEHFGINIKNIGYSLQNYSDENCKTFGGLDFHCEITSLHGNRIEQEVYLRGAALNSKGEIIGTSDPFLLDPEEFYVEQLWSTGFCLNYRGIKSLKIYLSKNR